ncbi:hypothetical protein [Xylanimonas protaetiae]|uniref:Uncharacterized protein n=1 Tax=Xylanimonas protaetiae TaxID=2509457 RepID=A0A4P6FBN9_9MICO|nr:hypothetical protein [Xylanimonas protaetiae]QAY70917.1 hypothetical protein ET471_13515 [Xylanimonas protaetiae]
MTTIQFDIGGPGLEREVVVPGRGATAAPWRGAHAPDRRTGRGWTLVLGLVVGAGAIGGFAPASGDTGRDVTLTGTASRGRVEARLMKLTPGRAYIVLRDGRTLVYHRPAASEPPPTWTQMRPPSGCDLHPDGRDTRFEC